MRDLASSMGDGPGAALARALLPRPRRQTREPERPGAHGAYAPTLLSAQDRVASWARAPAAAYMAPGVRAYWPSCVSCSGAVRQRPSSPAERGTNAATRKLMATAR